MPIALILNIPISTANNNAILNNFEKVYHLEYFLRFSPTKDGYSETKYALDFEKYNESGESYIKISIYYEDLQLTIFNDNFSYIISLSSREILEASDNDYSEYLLGTHTELFLKPSEFENSNKIRIDEPLTFSDYLKDYQDPQSLRSDVTFNYVGIEQYYLNSQYNFTSYHYKITHVLWTEGDF